MKDALEIVMEICEEEIERTSQEAVKAALLEVGGELSFEKERADQLAILNAELKLKLRDKEKKEKGMKINSFLNGLYVGIGLTGLTAGIFSVIFN